VLGSHIPPSTSTLTQGLLLADQEIEMHMIAVVPAGDFKPTHIRPKDEAIHHTSAYSLALAAGDHVFIAGRMADGGIGEGLAPAARMPARHLWKGTPVKLEAEYVIEKKLVRALEAADCSLADIVKLQVYLRDLDDFAPFNDVWRAHFGDSRPATTLVPTATPGFFLEDAHIEINAIALRPGGRESREVIDVAAGGLPAFHGYPQAVRAGDLLLFSGMLAIDADGPVAGTCPDPAKPWFGSSIRSQMQVLLDRAQKVCAAAGTSLANVVRIQQYHTDFREFQGACDAWKSVLPGVPLPLSAVQVPFLPAPACSVMLDVWVYVP
jgi:enamine deaminase RidA (YjgF/YER057c/UK114 family)